MSEYFIVLSHEPQQHETLEDARCEQIALAKHFPDRAFRVHRCKTWLAGAKHFTKMVDLLGDIVREGLTPANLDRARVLLITIGNRTPRLKVTPHGEYVPPPGAKVGA